MAYKFTIKGIRKFNEEKVVEKALLSFRGIANDPEVKVMYHEPSGEEKESYTVMTVNVSTQGVNIKHLIGGNIIVELPKQMPKSNGSSGGRIWMKSLTRVRNSWWLVRSETSI